MKWTPAGLPLPIVRLAEAIEGRFQLARPKNPVRVPEVANPSDLPPARDWRTGLVLVADVGGGLPVLAFSDGTSWRRADTSGTI